MKKKQQKTQLFLILVGLLLIFGTYFYYPYIVQEKDFFKRKTVEKDKGIGDEEDKQISTFQDVEYKGFYDFDKPFVVKSREAKIANDDPNVVYMNNMHVTLYLNDGRIVEIVSDKGRYNKITYDCYFEQNVKAIEGKTIIQSDNLDLIATNKNVMIYNNVYLDYDNGSLKADKINYDFETKYFKVSMFDEKKIQINMIK